MRSRQRRALTQHFGALGEKRTQREHEYMIEAGRHVLGPGGAGSRRRAVPLLDDGLERVAFARERDDRLVVGDFERVETQQHIGVLPEREPEVAPLERDVAEPHERASGFLLILQPAVLGRDPRERHAGLQPALDIEERDLQIDGRREIGLRGLEFSQRDDFTRFGPGRTDGTLRLIGRLLVGHLCDSIVSRMPSVLLIGSEAVPFAKTGGLADVLGALPPALARLGWDATLVVPRYRGVTAGTLAGRFPVSVGGYTRDIGFYEAPLGVRGDGAARAILIDCPDLYDRDSLYGEAGVDYPDSPRRFAVLARAALEWSVRLGTPPSIVHAHDWQAGLAPVYLRRLYASHPLLRDVPAIFTIHNLAYQGLFASDWLPRLDLGWAELAMDRLEFWGRISLLKGGIVDADVITTVSRTYAKEIQTPELGFGFDGILRARSADLVGILNGIDTRAWDPMVDSFLPTPYDADHLEGKAAAKRSVLARYELPTDAATVARPLVGMISRMVDQKGLDLIQAISTRLPSLDASFVILGTGDPRYQDMWRTLAAAHPDRIGVHVGFDESLAHIIEAGADIFMMPSKFEPCGLNQMYSLRYGTVPVVRAVGGLADTVKDGVTGFAFADYSPEALLVTLQRALVTFRAQDRWRALQVEGMRQDNSWDHSAQEYVTIYRRAIEQGTKRLGLGTRG